MQTTPFQLNLPASIECGRGCSTGAAAAIRTRGQRVLLVHGSRAERANWLVDALTARDAALETMACPREPDLALVEAGVKAGRAQGVEVVVALGGGAAIDLAKALAGLIPAHGAVLDYLEVVGRGAALDATPLPWVALPTTAGTGAEVTANAVIGVPKAQRKVSLRDPRLLADLAFVDPALTDDSPAPVTLASGLDAMTQVIEPYISRQANRFTDLLCRDAVPRGLRALQALMQSESSTARDEMAWVSLCGGLALANAKLGAVHGLAGPLGGVLSAPHGAIAGALLPPVLHTNRALCQGESARRIDQVLDWIGEAFAVDRSHALEALAQWSRREGLPGLDAMGLRAADRGAIAEAATASSSMQGNPVTLSVSQLVEIMEAAA